MGNEIPQELKDEVRGYEEQPIKDLIKKIDSNLIWIKEDAVNSDRKALKTSYMISMDLVIMRLQEAKFWAEKMLEAMKEPVCKNYNCEKEE